MVIETVKAYSNDKVRGDTRLFLSYHHSDADEVDRFIRQFQSAVHSMSTIGVTDGDLALIGADLAALPAVISARYLRDTDATIVLIGQSTWSRRFIDWEIAATLAGGTEQRRALIGLALPSIVDRPTRVPARLAVNLGATQWPGYAVMSDYPETPRQLNDTIGRARHRRNRQEPREASFGQLMRRDHPNHESSR